MPIPGSGLACDHLRSSSKRLIGDKTIEQRFYISSLEPDAVRLSQSIRANWTVENRLYWRMDVVFQDDQMRVRIDFAAHNLALLKHITLNLICLDPVKRRGGLKARRLIASTSDDYRATPRTRLTFMRLPCLYAPRLDGYNHYR